MSLQPPASAKAMTARVSLLALGATFELTSKYVPDMQQEVANWEEGRRVGIGVLPSGPHITICKRGDRIVLLGAGLQDPDVSILFKNMDSALMLFTAQIGAPQAVAENRVCVHGENAKAMQVTRAMAIVQTYLFPALLLRKTFKRPPKLGPRELAIKALIMGQLPARLVTGAFK